MTNKPDISYASAVMNTAASTECVNHKLAQKDKEIADLKSLLTELKSQIVELSNQVKILAASTQQKQRKEDDTESQLGSVILAPATPARDSSGTRSVSNRSSSAERLPRRGEQDMEATVS